VAIRRARLSHRAYPARYSGKLATDSTLSAVASNLVWAAGSKAGNRCLPPPCQGWPKRSVPVRQRKKIQEVLPRVSEHSAGTPCNKGTVGARYKTGSVRLFTDSWAPEPRRPAHSFRGAWTPASEPWVWVLGQMVGSKPESAPLVKGLRRGGASSRTGLPRPNPRRPRGATAKVASCVRRSCSIGRLVAARLGDETFPGPARRRLLLARPQSLVARPPTTASLRPSSNPGWRHHRDRRACRSSRRPWPAPRPRRRFSPASQSRPRVHSLTKTGVKILPWCLPTKLAAVSDRMEHVICAATSD
jgi:hypothetical protein